MSPSLCQARTQPPWGLSFLVVTGVGGEVGTELLVAQWLLLPAGCELDQGSAESQALSSTSEVGCLSLPQPHLLGTTAPQGDWGVRLWPHRDSFQKTETQRFWASQSSLCISLSASRWPCSPYSDRNEPQGGQGQRTPVLGFHLGNPQTIVTPHLDGCLGRVRRLSPVSDKRTNPGQELQMPPATTPAGRALG